MRKLFFLALISISFMACEDVVDPRPVIQGEANGTLFRSATQVASNSGGNVTIQGANLDILTLEINGNNVGVYEITPNSGNVATFEIEGVVYNTNGPETSGMIEIEEITPLYITGNFFFEARRNGTGESLAFSKGVFYQIPFSTLSPGG
jgi:hypothetical protein